MKERGIEMLVENNDKVLLHRFTSVPVILTF